MDALDTEEGFISSAGLTMDQLRTSMKSFLHHTLRCIPEGTQPEGVVYTEIKVACTGQVDQVVILDTDTMPDDLVECVQKTLKYTPFPAHDMPDGFVFEYPVRFSF